LSHFQVIIFFKIGTFQAPDAVQSRSFLFGDVERCMLVGVLPTIRKKISVPVNGHVSQDRPLRLRPICCPKTPVSKHQPRPYNIPERRT